MRLLIAASLVAVLAGCGTGSGVLAPVAPPAAPSAAPSTSGPPAAPAPAITGTAPAQRYQVRATDEVFQRGDRTLRTRIWAPVASGQKFPVIVFSHGLRGLPADYTSLLSRWAAAGFVIAAPAYPFTNRNAPSFEITDVLNQPADASYVLDQVLAKRTDVLPDRLAAAGHSGGGVTTIGLFTVSRDQRLRAGIVLAGTSLGVGLGFAGPPAPLLYVHGEADDVVAYEAGRAAFEATPWPRALLRLPGAGHGEPYLRASSPEFGATAATTLDFLRYTLYGDAAARSRLPADAEPAGVLEDKL